MREQWAACGSNRSYSAPEDLQAWEELRLEAAVALGEPLRELEILKRDAGPRAYARASTPRRSSVILVDASGLDAATMNRFWRIADLLDRVGVGVPRRLAHVPRRRLSVITDLGRDTLCVRSRLDPSGCPSIQAVLAPLVKMIGLRSSVGDGTYELTAQLRDFTDVFVPAARNEGWVSPVLPKETFEFISVQTRELSPSGLVHADYHSRNLVVGDERQIGVLDFQDAAIGPVAVDWAAIVYDHNRLPAAGDIRLWEREAVAALGTRIEGGRAVRCLRWAGLVWHLRLAGACTRLLRWHGLGRFAEELRSVGRWLDVLAEMPELTQFRELARSVARGTRLVAARA